MALTDNNLSFFKGSYESLNINHGISELLYLFSNLFQQQDRTNLSKLFFSLSNYLNPSFISNKLLIFKNQLVSKQSSDFDEKLSQSISNLGGEFYWYVNFNKLSFDQDNLTRVFEKENVLLFGKHLLHNTPPLPKESKTPLKPPNRPQEDP